MSFPEDCTAEEMDVAALTEIDTFRSLLENVMFDEAEAMITPEMCEQRTNCGRHALELAIGSGGPLTMVRRILEIAPELARVASYFGYTPIQQAFRVGHLEQVELVKIFLALDPETVAAKSTNEKEETAIFTMVRLSTNTEMFHLLHAAAEAIGYDDLSERDGYGNTLLHHAVLTSADIVEAIVALRPTLAQEANNYGELPLRILFSNADRFLSSESHEVIFRAVYFPEAVSFLVLRSAIHSWDIPFSIKEYLLEAHPHPELASLFADQKTLHAISGGRL
jgi:ankyrin repeat protein